MSDTRYCWALDRWTDEWGIPRQYRVERLREHTVTLDPVEGDDE